MTGKNILSLGTANIINKVIWSLLVLLLIRTLGPEHYGFLSTIWAIGALLAPFSDFGGSQLLLREGTRNRGIASSLYNKIFRFKLIVSFIIIIIGAVIANAIFWTDNLYPKEQLIIICVIGVMIHIVDHLHTMAVPILQISKKLFLFAIYRTGYFIGLLLLLSVIIVLGANELSINICYLLVTLVWLIFFLRISNRELPESTIAAPSYLEIFHNSKYFGWMAILNLAYYRLDLIIVSSFAGAKMAGIYGAQYQIVLIFFMFPSICFNALFSTLYKQQCKQSTLQPYFDLLMRYINIVALFVFITLLYFGQVIMDFIGGDAYLDNILTFRILSLWVLLFFCAVALNFLNVVDKVGVRVRYTAYSIFITGLGGVFCVPFFGIKGMAVISVMSYLLSGILAHRHLISVHKFKYKTWLFSTIRAVISACCAAVATYFIDNSIISFCLFCILYVAMLVVSNAVSMKEIKCIIQLRNPLTTGAP